MVDPFLLPVVSVVGGVPVASSRDVAAYMEREHVLILRAVDDLVWESAPAVASQFREVAEQGGRFFWMTRQGFLMLARGLTGPNAGKRRDRYAEAFDREARKLPHAEARPGGHVPAAHGAEVSTQAGPLVPAMPAAGAPLTMSSREIAELTGKRHDHVMRDIRGMLIELYGAEEVKAGLPERDAFEVLFERMGWGIRSPTLGNERVQGVSVTRDNRGYLAEIALDYAHSMTLIAGYKAKLRKAIVDRWQHLEKAGGNPVAFNPGDPQIVAAFLSHWHQEATTAQAALAVAEGTLARIEGAEGSVSITDAAKALSHPIKPFFAKLYRNRWTFRRGGKGDWLAHADKCRAGLMDHRAVTYENNGERVLGTQAMVTPKGLRVLADLLANDPAWRD